MKLDLEHLRSYQKKNLLRARRHPSLPLTIWHYTPTCMFDRKWDETTIMARGIVTDDEGHVVARPFKKFFNHDELESLGLKSPAWPPLSIEEKIDGGLVILFWYEGEWRIASRQAFDGSHAERVTEMFEKFKGIIDWTRLIDGWKNKTHLFEAIYKENRIVVDYGEMERLSYLGSVDNETGEEMDVLLLAETFGKPLTYEAKDVESLVEKEGKPNREGFVLRWANGTRLKVKLDEYKRIHAIVTSTSSLTVWKALRDKKDFSSMLERMPDEFYEWAFGVYQELQASFNAIQHKARVDLNHALVFNPANRKELAKALFEKAKYPGLSLALHDRKDVTRQVLQMIRPKETEPFFKKIET